jgi:uroporphyrinogen-III synthase
MLDRPLDGFVVGVTADRRAEEQSEMLRRRGARVLRAPVIRTLPLAADEGIRSATEALVAQPPTFVVANTGIGIRSWFGAAESWGLGEALREALMSARVLARGPKAAGAMLTAGLPVEWRAPSESLAEVVDAILTSPVEQPRVAFQLDGGMEQPEVQRLRDAGADVVEVPVYSWSLPEDERPALRLVDAADADRLDAITFTSAAAVRNLFQIAERNGRADDLRQALSGRVVAVCVGPVCAEAAAELGVTGVQPARARLGAMIHTLDEELQRQQRRYLVAGIDVLAQGSLVVVDGMRVSLSDRERGVFDLLSARPRAVVTRSELLRALWSPAADEHALEVTVARLRRRLGAAGDAIITVVRRGYRFDADRLEPNDAD